MNASATLNQSADPNESAEATRRDHGLVRGIGVAALAASVVNITVGAGIFTLPASVALLAGHQAPAVYGVCALIMVAVTLCFAEAGSRVPTSGGAYGTVVAAFGPAAGFVTAVLLLLSNILASGGVAAGLADLLGARFAAIEAGMPRLAVVLAIYALIVAINLASVRTTARLISVATAIKLLPLLLFVAIGALTIGRAAPFAPPSPPVPHDFGRALIVALFAFEGMETALGASGEVRAPNRTLPRALFLAMLFVLALYLAIQMTAQHVLGAALAHATAPLAQAAGAVYAPAGAILFAGAGLSMLAWMASDILGSSRMIFALARDGRIPGFFGHLTLGRKIPGRAVMAYAAGAACLAAMGSFLELITLASLSVVAVYCAVAAAAVVLSGRRTALEGPPLGSRLLKPAALVAVGGMIFMISAARRVEIAGLAAAVLLSLALYALGRWARRGRARGRGRGRGAGRRRPS